MDKKEADKKIAEHVKKITDPIFEKVLQEAKKNKSNGTEITGTLKSIDKDVLKELLDNPSGLRANTIIKLVGKPRRTVYNSLNRLKALDLAQNVYPIWKLAQSQSEPQKLAKLLKSNKIQLHDFSFVIRLIRKPDWWERRKNRLMKIKEFQVRPIKWGNNPYTQMIKNTFLIQMFSNSMIFINQKNYWGEDPYDCFIQATKDFLDTLNYLEQRLRFKFFLDGIPQVSVRTQHNVKLDDIIANRCKKTGDQFEVNIDGTLRLLVDKSNPYGLEGVSKNHSPEDIKSEQRVHADILTHPETPMPSKVYELTAKNTEQLNQMIQVVKDNQISNKKVNQVIDKLEAQITSHLKLIQEYREENIKYRKSLKEPTKKPPKRDPDINYV